MPALRFPTPPALLRRRPVRRLDFGESVELVDHLDELRKRLFIAIGGLAVTFTFAYVNHKQVIEWLNKPLPADIAQPITIGIAEPFMTSIKVSMYAAFAMALPLLLWQLWGFLAPTMEKHARRTIMAFVTVATLLFVAGMAFSYLVALPSSVKFLTGFDSDLYNVQIRAQQYYMFAAAVLVSVGLVFELPVFLLALVRFRILTAEKMRKNRKIAYVSLTALAVLLPGVDPVLTLMELAPLALLYEITVWLARIFERRWDRARDIAAEEAAAADAAA